MSEFSLIGRDGSRIAHWRDWPRPKAEHHWRAGRSAMELGQAWFTSAVPTCPPEVQCILQSHPGTTGVQITQGWPEYVTPLPERGEGRNHDLLLVGSSKEGHGLVLSVEAKVDEAFGDRIGGYWRKARNLVRPTRAPQRIEALVSMVFGTGSGPNQDPWASLRYQLLTAVAGTAIEAARREFDVAVVIVHEFLTESAETTKVADNARDFRDFVRVLLADQTHSVQPGQLYGPVPIPPNKNLPRAVNLFIGKAVFDWRNNAGPAQ